MKATGRRKATREQMPLVDPGGQVQRPTSDWNEIDRPAKRYTGTNASCLPWLRATWATRLRAQAELEQPATAAQSWERMPLAGQVASNLGYAAAAGTGRRIRL